MVTRPVQLDRRGSSVQELPNMVRVAVGSKVKDYHCYDGRLGQGIVHSNVLPNVLQAKFGIYLELFKRAEA